MIRRVKVYWTIEDDKGSDGFYILKSNGDNNFIKIGSVKSSGQGTYTSATSLYNLSINDNDQDGDVLNSNIVSVLKNDFLFFIFPNPAYSNGSLSLDFNSSNHPLNISILNSDGSEIVSYSNTDTFKHIDSFIVGLEARSILGKGYFFK